MSAAGSLFFCLLFSIYPFHQVSSQHFPSSKSKEVLPSDPLLVHQWSFHNRGWIIDRPNYLTKVGADGSILGAWSLLGSLGSSEITIAIFDEGFALNHVEFTGKVVSTLNTRTGSHKLPFGPSAGGHGTSVTSIAAAAANNKGMVGVAPNSMLVLIDGLSFSQHVIGLAFRFCLDYKVDIVNCSWGTTNPSYRPGPAQIAAIQNALTNGREGKGIIVVFAAGNEGLNRVNYYGQIPGVITVGASTSSDEHAKYSNQGPGISVVAPSSGAWPVIAARASWGLGNKNFPVDRGYYIDGNDRSREYRHFSGTSSAAAFVSGVCALILSANPELTNTEVKYVLEQTADKIGSSLEYDASGYSLRYGYGRVNAERAVGMAQQMRNKSKNGVFRHRKH